MPNLRSLKFWLTLSAAATFTIGAIRAAAAASPQLTILSPTTDQVITGQQVPVQLAVENYSPSSSFGHFHLWLDQVKPTKTSAINIASPTYTFTNVKAGRHTLLAEMVADNHSSLTPPATASVSFTTQSPSATPAPSQSSVLIMAITAFLLVVAALFLVSPKLKGAKTTPHFGKLAKKSVRKHSKRK